jgi:O-antigen ligase
VKWIYLLAILIMAPALAGLLRSNRRYLVRTCFLLGASMLLAGPILWTAPYGWPLWSSPVEGFEISFVDSVAFALFTATRAVRIPLSIKVSFAIICLALTISTAIAYNPIAALFYVWEVLRATLLFLAMARVYATEPRAAIAFLGGLAVGMVGEPVWVALQYMQGAARPGGSFGHSNTFGIAADFVVFPAVALMLGGRRWFWPALAVFSAFVCVVLGGSRASVGLLAAGVLLTTMLSIAHKPSSRKFVFMGGLGFLLLVAAPVMIWSLDRRSEAAKESSDQLRGAMKAAARMIIADHPFGVGPNQYSVVANVGGYAGRAGVAWNEQNRRAPVHDTYYLVAAEMGFIGLIGFMALLASLILVGIGCLRRHLPDDDGEVAVGLLAVMIVVSVHIAFEFTFMSFMLHYLFASSAGILAAMWSRSKALAAKTAVDPIRSGVLSPAS